MEKIILIAFLLLSSQVQAAPPAWLYPTLKVKNPNELAVFVFADEECPVTTDEAKEIVSGVLIRSRVKPLVGYEWLDNSLYLGAEISCVKLKSGNQVFSIDAIFGSYSVTPPVHYPYPYGYTGIGPKDYIVSNFKRQVEAAVTDYIAANFDL